MKRIQIHDEFNLSEQDLENVIGGYNVTPIDYNYCIFCTQCINCSSCINCESCVGCQANCAVCLSVVMT